MAMEDRACLNCGAVVPANFCGECGQRFGERSRSLSAWAADVVKGVFDLDSKLLRTLKGCLLDPGRLAREYDAGRRIRYVSPLRLYFLVSAPVIAVMFWLGGFDAKLDEATVQMLGIEGHEESYIRNYKRIFPALNASSPFWLALALKTLSPRYLYQQHLTLSLYYMVAVYLVTLPAAIDFGHWLSPLLIVVAFIAYAIYSVLRFYDWSGGGRVLRTAGFVVLLVVILAAESMAGQLVAAWLARTA